VLTKGGKAAVPRGLGRRGRYQVAVGDALLLDQKHVGVEVYVGRAQIG
jgi:hypothetical protein